MTLIKNTKIAQLPQYQRALNFIASHGPSSYLDIESRLGVSGMHRVFGYLQQNRMILGLRKIHRCELRKYQITALGLEAIGKGPKVERSTPVVKNRISKRGVLVASDAMPARAGSMAAYSIPSLGGRLPPHVASGVWA